MTMTKPTTHPYTNRSARSLPHGWRWVPLGEVCKVVSGSTPSSGVADYWDGDITWITPTDLGRLDGKYIVNSARRITAAGYESCGAELLPPGTVVLSSRAPIGYLGIASVNLCTNQGCKSFVPTEAVDSDFLYFALKQAVSQLQALGSGATFAEVSKSQLQTFEIPLPPLPEQQRIAARLTEQLAAVEQARAAAAAQLAAAADLPAAYLRAVFTSPAAQTWPRRPLGDILQLRKEVVHPHDNPQGPATFVGLEHVQSLTGLRIGAVDVVMEELTGRKPRFYQGDIVYGYLRPYLNKVWIAEFDGLCSVDQYVYSVNARLADTTFIAWFMRSPVYLERAPIDTTPGQLPRIRTEEVAAVEINLPSVPEQQRIAAQLTEQMAAVEQIRTALTAQLATITTLPATLLRRAFTGQIAEPEKMVPVEDWLRDLLAARGGIVAYVINQLHQQESFGRVEIQKADYLVPTFIGVPLAGQYVRARYGPYDPQLETIEELARSRGWITKRADKVRDPHDVTNTHRRYRYGPGPRIAEALQLAEQVLGNQKPEMDRLLTLFAPLRTAKVEQVATLFAAWNDFLLDGHDPSDDEIINEVRTNWHELKRQFAPEVLQQTLAWMRENQITPRGIGPHTEIINAPQP